MRRDAFPDLNSFLLVAEHLSFQAARPDVRLLNRTARSVSLTHAGLRLVDRVRVAFDQISGAIKELNEERQRPVGRPQIWVSPVAAAGAADLAALFVGLSAGTTRTVG
jgi:hypothetical protein